MKQKVTLQSLAKQLGVSVSTVSKALNNSAEISDETRQRVQNLAKERNYRPNAIATNLRNKSSMAIAVIVPDLTNGFFAEAVEGMEEMARSEGYKLITCISKDDPTREDDYIHMFNNGGVDGFIIAVSEGRQRQGNIDIFEELIEDGIPLVMFDRVLDDIECDKIVIDDRKSGKRVVEFLLERKAKNLIIATTIGDLSVAKYREQGMRQRASVIEGAQVHTVQAASTDELQKSLVERLDINPAQAIVALDQLAGLAALNAVRHAGKRVPEDIQVISYADGSIARNTLPKLTVVDQHAQEIGRKAVVRMLNLMRSKDDLQITRTHTIRSTIVERDSTQAPAI